MVPLGCWPALVGLSAAAWTRAHRAIHTEVLGNLSQISLHPEYWETQPRGSLFVMAHRGSSPAQPSSLPVDQGEPPRGFKEALLTPTEGPVKLGLAWNWIRHQETEKQQASGEGSEEGGPTDPSGQTLTAPTLALTDAGISDRFCAGWFSHSIVSL